MKRDIGIQQALAHFLAQRPVTGKTHVHLAPERGQLANDFREKERPLSMFIDGPAKKEVVGSFIKVQNLSGPSHAETIGTTEQACGLETVACQQPGAVAACANAERGTRNKEPAHPAMNARMLTWIRLH